MLRLNVSLNFKSNKTFKVVINNDQFHNTYMNMPHWPFQKTRYFTRYKLINKLANLLLVSSIMYTPGKVWIKHVRENNSK